MRDLLRGLQWILTKFSRHLPPVWRYSESCLSGSIEKEMSKAILAFSTNKEVVQVFQKTLTGGFGGVNTRLALDTEILMPNISRAEFHKITIDKGFQVFKRQDLKVGDKLKLDGWKTYSSKRVISNTAQKMKFPADLVTFTGEILNEKLHFLSSEK